MSGNRKYDFRNSGTTYKSAFIANQEQGKIIPINSKDQAYSQKILDKIHSLSKD